MNYPEIRARQVPDWLDKLDNLDCLPIRELLTDSLYYPASGRDGDPVRFLGGLAHSFVYVDYGLERDEVWESLHDDHHGFSGYRIFACRDVERSELSSEQWIPVDVRPEIDGNFSAARGFRTDPFAIWAIYDRLPALGDDHGPRRFSILIIGAEGTAAFRALYSGHQTHPLALAIIQPGHGFGGNWTNFFDPRQILARTVYQNPHGQPRYLLYGGWGRDYRPACWPEFERLVQYWKIQDGEIGLWER